MPYTPPSAQSPASSNPSSPGLSRSQSYLKNQPQHVENAATIARPGLPRSTGSSSYLSRHRRSPSMTKTDDASNANAVSFMVNGDSTSQSRDGQRTVDPHGSIRQSPPPANNALIPTGATLSPPDSTNNSSDDEESSRGRGRDLANLAELQEAIRIIDQRKEGSPARNAEDSRRARMALDLIVPSSDGTLSTPNNTSADSSRPPLSREARKISHSRSSTDSNIVLDLGRQVQSPVSLGYKQSSDEDEEDDSDETASRSKPQMVRKKSGELVRPALRPSSARRRPSSMPGTPTYGKAVHFDSNLEHVRHFLQVDRPLAVSAGSSPVENYESEVEFPFGYGSEEAPRSRGSLYEWEIRLANFPSDADFRQGLPVRVERVFLSSDNKTLVGAVAVQNLAFNKQVVARFTLDYWKTTSEVVADYNHDVRRRRDDGCDRFNFTIKLADLANLENKTMFFCIRYSVNARDFWDNNSNVNYQVDFSKKAKAQHGKNGMPGLGARPLNALPRSGLSPPKSNGGRPHTQPTSFDDFASGFDAYSSFGRSPAHMMGDSPIKLKKPQKSRPEIVPDAPTRRTKASAQAFGHRYDFGASLSAAIQNASNILGDQSGLKPKVDAKQSSRQVPASSSIRTVNGTSAPTVSVTAPLTDLSSKPDPLLSGKPPLASQSYQELVDKYCFFGSQRTSPQLNKTTLNMFDGANDEHNVSDVSVGSISQSTSGSSTPTPPRSSSPPSQESPLKTSSPELTRSQSPVPRTGSHPGSRTTSPVSFGYPYHQPPQHGLFSDSPAPAAIHG